MSDPGNPSDPNAVPPPAGWPAQPPPGYGPPPPGYGPPQPGWGAPPPPAYGAGYGGGYGGYGGYPAPPRTDGKAIGALVSSIGSFVICPFVPAVVGVVLAGQAKRSIRESGGQLTGESMVTAARIIGWVNIVLCFLVVAIFALTAVVSTSTSP